jgi:hypothetical protein
MFFAQLGHNSFAVWQMRILGIAAP